MENMSIYERVAAVPDHAKKTINAGRLKGMTDISPMWRIEKLTELFGPCGFGWWYEITGQRLEKGSGDEVKAFVDINLYYKVDGEVSMPVPGIGGSSFIAKETKGTYTSDECFKMALTDAISVAAKALGVGADIYMGADRDKYNTTADDNPPPPQAQPRQQPQQDPEPPSGPDGYYYCTDCGNLVTGRKKANGDMMYPKDIAKMSYKAFGCVLCADCGKKRNAAMRS